MANETYSYGSSAIDLDLFAERERYKRKNPIKKKTKKNTPKKKTAAAAAKAQSTTAVASLDHAELIRSICIAAITAITLTLLIISQVRSHELTRDIERTNGMLVALQQDYDAIQADFNSRMSDTAVEEYAINVLGMQKREYSQTEYISLGTGDVFEFTSNDKPGQDSSDADISQSYLPD